MNYTTLIEHHGYLVLERRTLNGWNYELRDEEGHVLDSLGALPARLTVSNEIFELWINDAMDELYDVGGVRPWDGY